MEFPFFRVRESVWKFKFFILRSLWTINYRGAKLRLRKFEKADLKDSNLDIAGIQQIFSPRAFVFWVLLCLIVRISLRESSYSRIYSLLWNFWLVSNLQVIIGESPIRKRNFFFENFARGRHPYLHHFCPLHQSSSKLWWYCTRWLNNL